MTPTCRSLTCLALLGMAGVLAGAYAYAQASTSTPAPIQEPQATPDILPFEPDTLQAIAKIHGAHPYWLILWDLDCVYCMKSMQNLATLQKTHPELNIITVATDSIDENDALQQRLQSIGLKSSNYAFGAASNQALRFAIDPSWRGEKPRAYFYAPGQARRTLLGVLDEARVLKP